MTNTELTLEALELLKKTAEAHKPISVPVRPRMLLRLCAAARKHLEATAAEPKQDENGWVIERGDSEPCAPLYYDGLGWTPEHDLAIRHARKIDAERVAEGLDGYDHRICEHIWAHPSKQDGWRDISSAPKDKSIVDLWCVDDSEQENVRQTRRPDCQWGEMSDWAGNIIEGWRGMNQSFREWRPTHWMHKPFPPREQEAEKPNNGAAQNPNQECVGASVDDYPSLEAIHLMIEEAYNRGLEAAEKVASDRVRVLMFNAGYAKGRDGAWVRTKNTSDEDTLESRNRATAKSNEAHYIASSIRALKNTGRRETEKARLRARGTEMWRNWLGA